MSRTRDFGKLISHNYAGDFGVDGSTFVIDADSDKIGIGHLSPNSTLHVRTSGTDLGDLNSGVRIENNTLGTDSDGALGSGITFAQRWWSNSTTPARTGAVMGRKTYGTGNFGGGLSFYSQPPNGDPMEEAFRINHTQDTIWGAGADKDPGTITAGTQSGMVVHKQGYISSSRATTSNSYHQYFHNSSGQVGRIATEGNRTVFETTGTVSTNDTGNVSLSREGLRGDGIKIFENTSFGMTTTAQDTYVNSSYLLSTAPYMLSCQVNSGGWYSETWSGIMQWYAASTNSNDATNITLTGMGHAPNGRVLYARVKRYGGNNQNHSLQIWSSSTDTVHLKIYAMQLSSQGW